MGQLHEEGGLNASYILVLKWLELFKLCCSHSNYFIF